MQKELHEFTFIELRNFKVYEEVRSSGQFNMFDPRAREQTGLTPGEFMFVMTNYSELREAYKQSEHE